MLSQLHRLKRSEDIAIVFRRGKGFHSPFFSVKYLPQSSSKQTRLAFSFGKKQLPRAVDRNLLKRLLIAELQKVPDFFELGLDVVFFLSKPLANSSLKTKKELSKSIDSFLKAVYNGSKLEK